jgi:hypothetical protein
MVCLLQNNYPMNRAFITCFLSYIVFDTMEILFVFNEKMLIFIDLAFGIEIVEDPFGKVLAVSRNDVVRL